MEGEGQEERQKKVGKPLTREETMSWLECPGAALQTNNHRRGF